MSYVNSSAEQPVKPGKTSKEASKAVVDALEGDGFLVALGHVDFLVVQDFLLRKSAGRVHVVLPATSFLEQDGAFTNIEHRIRQLLPVKAEPGGTLPDWRILADLIERLHSGGRYGDAHSIYREIMEVVPFYAEPFQRPVKKWTA